MREKALLVTGYLLISLVALGLGYRLTPSEPPKVLYLSPSPSTLVSLPPLPEEEAPKTIPVDQGETSPLPPVETYFRTLEEIKALYYGPIKSNRELTYSAIRGMLASLNDRYTRFLEPDEYHRMLEDNQGEFGGIGAQLEKTKGKVIIKRVLENTPAQRARLKPGDVILKVNGKPVSGLSIFQTVDRIRGPRGTRVVLEIQRSGVAKPLTFTLVRDIIKLETVKATMLKGGIARIELTSFNQLADEELGKALEEMKKKGMKALILDLRNNPGGLLSEAVAIASRFVPEGPVVIVQERGGRRKIFNADPRKRLNPPVPLVVLVNKLSASASEIVAGAIKDTKRGIIVGTDTWGKGLVQTITPIPIDGSALLITTHRYYTPAGIDINQKGITPDVRVEPTEKDLKANRDPQLERAIAILNGEFNPQAAQKAEKSAP